MSAPKVIVGAVGWILTRCSLWWTIRLHHRSLRFRDAYWVQRGIGSGAQEDENTGPHRES
jgi:hypothetical protein